MAVKRIVTTAGVGVLATTTFAGTAATAWACPSDSHDRTRASVHQAVAHGYPVESTGGTDADCENDGNGDGTLTPCANLVVQPDEAAAPDDVEDDEQSAGQVPVAAAAGAAAHDTGDTSTRPTMRAAVQAASDESATATRQTEHPNYAAGLASPDRAATVAVLGERLSRTPHAAGTASAAASAPVTPSVQSVVPTPTTLPFTGSDDLPLLALIGASGVVTGAGLVRAARRRETPTTAKAAS